jgi:hypothetical protein
VRIVPTTIQSGRGLKIIDNSYKSSIAESA